MTGVDLQKTFGTKGEGLKLDTTLNGVKVGENELGSGISLDKSIKLQPSDHHRIGLMQKLKLEEEGRLPPVDEKVPRGLLQNMSPPLFKTSQEPALKDAFSQGPYAKKPKYMLVSTLTDQSCD